MPKDEIHGRISLHYSKRITGFPTNKTYPDDQYDNSINYINYNILHYII